MTSRIYVGPADGETESNSTILAELREVIMSTAGVDRIYPPASLPSKVIRTVGVAVSAVRSAVENILPSGRDDEAAVHSHQSTLLNSSEKLPQQKPLPESPEETRHINVRIGASAGANIPATARAVAQSIRAAHGDNVVITIDIVHV
ncbi:hypothetical protein [uncultured Rothia sp.]|uniref:hypothetical protein n=1 Tax=uncultured Rothia sp. TaxID=316088 RepID=UPI003217E8AC